MTADLALLASDPTSLDIYDDPGKQIVLACERANAWLKAGIEVRIETIVETRAQAAALAAFAIQKQLGHDAELGALEVQRRAERGIGLAIRRGQEQGLIAARGSIGGTGSRESGTTRNGDLLRVTDAAGVKHSSEMEPIYDLTDNVTDEQFDEAIEDAKSESNLSRANVVRKVKGEANGRLSGEKRLDAIRTRAATGHTSSQIADEIGHTPDYIRQICRDNGIELPADRAMNRTASNRRVDSTRVAREAVLAVNGLAATLRLINYDDIDPAEAREWATSLTDSIRALNRFTKQIKEIAQ